MVQARNRPSHANAGGDIIRQAQQKVSRDLVDEVASLSGLSKKEIASLIGLTERAIFKTTKGEFSILISEHLILLRALFQHGLAVFDQNKKAFTQWLRTPLPELASSQTGYFPVTPSASPKPLAEMSTKAGPYDLMEAARIRNEQNPQAEPASPPRPYPTPISLLNTTTGIGLVDDVCIRIEAGVYS